MISNETINPAFQGIYNNAAPQPVVPQPIQPATQPTQLQQSSQGGLDPKLVTLAQSIRQTESNGNFQAKGASGEYGAYQFMPDTWNGAASRFGVNVPLEQASPEQQNEVAYKQLQEWSTQHPDWNVGNFASAWNAGPGKPNAYLEGNAGNNSKGVSYDTAAYAKKVAETYQQLKAQNPSLNAPQTPQNAPTATLGGDTNQDPGFGANVMSGNFVGAAKNVFNGAFPIVSDLANDFNGSSTKTKLQQLGDLGMSALWFAPFGELAEGAGLGARALLGAGKGAEEAAALIAEALPTAENVAKAGALASKAKIATTAGNIATGLGAGYVGDVSNNLAQGDTGGAALKPGLGTVVGGVAPAVLTGAASFYNKFKGQQEIVNKVQQAYEDAAGATKSGISGMSKTAAKGLDSNPEFLANAGILPETEEINGRRVFTTGEDSVSQQTLQKRINDLTALRDEGISQAGQNTPRFLEDLRNTALQKAESEFDGTDRQSAIDHINQEFAAYKTQYGDGQGNINLTEENKIKMSLQGKTKFDTTKSTTINRTNKMMSAIARESVEKGADTAGLKNVGELNKIIQQHLDAVKFLQKINGQTIKGGRIGKYLAEGVGAMAGNAAGGVFGGGIGGAVGTVAGAGAGALFSHFLQKFTSGGTISAAAIGRMAQEEPQVVQQFLDYVGKNGEKIAPMLKPLQESGASVAQDVLHKTPGSKIRAMFDHEAASKHYTPQEIEDYLRSQEDGQDGHK